MHRYDHSLLNGTHLYLCGNTAEHLLSTPFITRSPLSYALALASLLHSLTVFAELEAQLADFLHELVVPELLEVLSEGDMLEIVLVVGLADGAEAVGLRGFGHELSNKWVTSYYFY